MMRRVLLASTCAMALAGTAFAADLPSQQPPPLYLSPIPVSLWTGPYLGSQIGYVWDHDAADAKFEHKISSAKSSC
jgi:outer membrane immunogenic protein